MSTGDFSINHVSDTSLLVAGCRAVESTRPDAFFDDPYAARLAGERGMAMFRELPHPEIMEFGIAIRTKFIDDLLLDTISTAGLTTVLSVGSGLDTRPWRLKLPADLHWIEVDLPAILDYKDALMGTEPTRCRRERLMADLNDPAQRRAIYTHIARGPALMITEGLLMYLPARTVDSLALETKQGSCITHWISDIITSSFSNAIGGGGTRLVRHVQADDHLEGEQILATIHRAGWATSLRRSYITDLAFASDRIARMMAGHPHPPTPPPFAPNDPAGVHLFVNSGWL